MYDEDIKKLDEWFDEKNDMLTYRTEDGQYIVDAHDMSEFCDFLREHHPDLIGIPCLVNNEGVFFTRDNLEDAEYI